MTIELKTGKKGELHISSEDDRLLHCRSFGTGAYVLSGCAVTMTSANKAHIAEGELMVQGGYVRITGGGEDVAIANGVAGQKRNTIIALTYTRDSNGIEAMSFAAVDGSSIAGTPSDPIVATNDINAGASSSMWKFARIQLDGLTVGTPQVLFATKTAALLDQISSLSSQVAALQDSVSQTKTFYFDSPCMQSRGNSKAPVQLNVCGNFCALYVNGLTTRIINEFTELVDSDGLAKIGEYLPVEFDSEQQRNIRGENKPVGCRLCGGSDPHLWLIKDTNLGDGSEMRFVFTWVR